MKNAFMVCLALGMSVATPLLAAREEIVPLASVPRPAMKAGQDALGTKPTLAKVVTGTRSQRYELLAKNDSDQRIGVQVRADGTILKRESNFE